MLYRRTIVCTYSKMNQDTALQFSLQISAGIGWKISKMFGIFVVQL